MSWAGSTDNVGVTGYLVHRNFQFLAWVAAGTTYVDNTVTGGGQTYRYEIRAQDAASNNSVPSAPFNIVVGTDTTLPSVPTNVNASTSGAQVTLTWSASTDNVGVTGYLVHQQTTRRRGSCRMGRQVPVARQIRSRPHTTLDVRSRGGRPDPSLRPRGSGQHRFPERCHLGRVRSLSKALRTRTRSRDREHCEELWCARELRRVAFGAHRHCGGRSRTRAGGSRFDDAHRRRITASELHQLVSDITLVSLFVHAPSLASRPLDNRRSRVTSWGSLGGWSRQPFAVRVSFAGAAAVSVARGGGWGRRRCGRPAGRRCRRW